MNIYNLTEKTVIISTGKEKYSVPPSVARFDLPHPRAMMTNVGFVDPVELFTALGEVQSFHWNDIVVVTPEQFAVFKFSCEVWIASGFNGKAYTRMCRVQPPVDPSTIKVPMDFDKANEIIYSAIEAAGKAHNLNDGQINHIRRRLAENSDGRLVSKTVELGENPKKLKAIINSALNEIGIIFH